MGELNGAFSERFAKRKAWKLDADLQLMIGRCMVGMRSAVDIGAGMGRYVEWLRSAGYKAFGIDGIPNIEKLSNGIVSEIDLTAGDAVKRFLDVSSGAWPELGICTEVGEHIPEEHLDMFLENISTIPAKRMLVSWAVPGQRGRDHVSCRSPEWVANRFGMCDWPLNESLTQGLRGQVGRGWNKKILVFER